MTAQWCANGEQADAIADTIPDAPPPDTTPTLVALGGDGDAAVEGAPALHLNASGEDIIARAPQIEGLESGALAVAWVERENASDDGRPVEIVHGAIVTPGSATPDIEIDLSNLMPDGIADGTDPVITSDAAGDLIVAWIQEALSGGYEAASAIFMRDGDRWLPPAVAQILNHFDELPKDFAIAVSGSGDDLSLVVAWRDADDNLTAVHYDVEQGRKGVEFTVQSNDGNDDGAGLGIANMGDGQVLVVYASNDGSDSDITGTVLDVSDSDNSSSCGSGKDDSDAAATVSISTSDNMAAMALFTGAESVAANTENGNAATADSTTGEDASEPEELQASVPPAPSAIDPAIDNGVGPAETQSPPPACASADAGTLNTGAQASVSVLLETPAPATTDTSAAVADLASDQIHFPPDSVDAAASDASNCNATAPDQTGPGDAGSAPGTGPEAANTDDASADISASTAPTADDMAALEALGGESSSGCGKGGSGSSGRGSRDDRSNDSDDSNSSGHDSSGRGSAEHQASNSDERHNDDENSGSGSGNGARNGSGGSCGSDDRDDLRLTASTRSSNDNDTANNDSANTASACDTDAALAFSNGYGNDIDDYLSDEEQAALVPEEVTVLFEALQFANAFGDTGNGEVIIFDGSNLVTISAIQLLQPNDPRLDVPLV